MSSLINKKYFVTAFFLLILVEFFSYLGWQNSLVSTICFSAIILATLILSWLKLEYGLYILFAELFVGSFGYLFSLSVSDFKISIRMGIFITVMGVWFSKFIIKKIFYHSNQSQPRIGEVKESKIQIPRLRFAPLGMTKKTLIFLGLVLIWAFFWGLIRGNGFSNVFLDFNNWLYFLVALPITLICTDKNTDKHGFIKNIISILSASVLFISLKTLILFYLFTHDFAIIGSDIYRFVRDTRIGEITLLGGGLYRIFIQSQIYALLLFCILFLKGCHPERSEAESRDPVDKNSKFLYITYYLLLITSFSTILLSLSRSFWLGLIFSLFLYCFIPLFLNKNIVAFFSKIAKIILIFAVSLILIYGVLLLPPQKNYDLSVLIAKRGISNSEPASTSRLNQLKPLLLAIVKHPVIGSGFGTTVLYKSDDPRITAPDHLISTYAFEWGYLDMLLKFGLVGTSIYLYLIYLILKSLANFQFPIFNFQINHKSQNLTDVNHYTLFIIHNSFLFALLALLIVNIFSPYLNHPLGIGFIIILLICTDKLPINTDT